MVTLISKLRPSHKAPLAYIKTHYYISMIRYKVLSHHIPTPTPRHFRHSNEKHISSSQWHTSSFTYHYTPKIYSKISLHLNKHTTQHSKHFKRDTLLRITNQLTFHMLVSRSTSCLPDISMASTLKTAHKDRE